MTKRIFRSICLVSVSVLLLAIALVIGALYSYFSATQKEQMRTQVRLAARAIEQQGSAYFEALGTDGAEDGQAAMTDSRITWISSDGTVLADTAADVGGLDNHLGREEIREALEMGFGESARYSDTLTERSIYAAARLSDGSVVRVSTTQLSLFTLIMSMSPQIALTLGIALIFSFLLSLYESRRLVKPLNELDLDSLPPTFSPEYEELSPLLQKLSAQQIQLRLHEAELRRRQEEFRAVTEGLSDGLILFNEQRLVISTNPAAVRLMPPPAGLRRRTKRPWIEGHPAEDLPAELGLDALLEAAHREGRAEQAVTVCNIPYRLHADTVEADGGAVGFVVLIVNMTEQSRNEQLRREFTANVSHELKTPLHTIAGCSEMLADGMIAPADIPAFAGRIHTEASRMIRLVEDIIGLSHLDEGAQDLPRTEVDITDIARRATAALLPMAEAAGVALSFEGDEPMTLVGIPAQLEAIVSNLCSNAVKYNRKGGLVVVSVRSVVPGEPHATPADRIRLAVRDTGIGIPEEHLDRIFERFYRVDKSRSQSVGGTGLGLSIVKHAVRLHGGRIEVDSRVGEGTTVTVWFR